MYASYMRSKWNNIYIKYEMLPFYDVYNIVIIYK